MWLPPTLRLQREQARYGTATCAAPTRAAQAQAFLARAAGYDYSTSGSRTLINHISWLNRFMCPVQELCGDLTVAERVAQILTKILDLGEAR